MSAIQLEVVGSESLPMVGDDVGTVVQGLLYIVEGVASSSPSYSALSDIMVLLSCVFIVVWGLVVLAAIADNCRTARQQGSGGRSGRKDSARQRCRRSAARLWHALAALLRLRGEFTA